MILMKVIVMNDDDGGWWWIGDDDDDDIIIIALVDVGSGCNLWQLLVMVTQDVKVSRRVNIYKLTWRTDIAPFLP
jgi:hypothetical protein